MFCSSEEGAELVDERGMAIPHAMHLEQMCEEILLHRLIAEGRQGIMVGNQYLSDAMNHTDDTEQMMHSTWVALDKDSEAAQLGRGRDIETEAIAVARRGMVYAKVIRNENLARRSLKHALTLAMSLSPRNFEGVTWYDDCKKQLQTYQMAAAAADERAGERRRQAELTSQEPVRKKMRAELAELDRYVNKVYEKNTLKLLEHIYEKYPPKVEAFTRDPDKVLKAIKDATADTIKRVIVHYALVHYHPDKNREQDHGIEWYILCSEITKHLNGKYKKVKGGGG